MFKYYFICLTYIFFNDCLGAVCKNGWTQGIGLDNNHCYKLMLTSTTFDDAISQCSALDAVLPVFGNASQFLTFSQQTLPLIFPDTAKSQIFTGYRRKEGTTTFIETDGTIPPCPLLWGESQPSGGGSNEQPGNCVTAGGYFKDALDDDSCSNPGHNFVCQYALSTTPQLTCDTSTTTLTSSSTRTIPTTSAPLSTGSSLHFKQKGCHQSLTTTEYSIISGVSATTEKECSVQCAFSAECCGINFNSATTACQLLNVCTESQTLVCNAGYLDQKCGWGRFRSASTLHIFDVKTEWSPSAIWI